MRGFALCGMMLFTLFFGAGAVRGAETAPQVLWQEISVSLEPERHLVIGRSTVAFAAGAGTVSFRLAQNARVDSVQEFVLPGTGDARSLVVIAKIN